MNFLKVAWRDISNIFKNRFIRASVSAIIIVPLLYSLLYLAAFWDPYSRLDKLPVVVVNLDKGGTLDGAPVNKGNDLTDKLKNDKQLGWHFASKSDADDGLKGTKYYAEFIIPENFTANSLSAVDANPKQPEIIYHANMKKNFLASQIINSGKKQLQAEIAQTMTEVYSKQAFGNLYQLKDGLNQATSQSNTMKDSIMAKVNEYGPQLKDGIPRLYDGSVQLNSGLGQINAQIPTLVNGISGAYSGSGTILDGVNNKIKPGANGLAAALATANDTKVPKLTQGAKLVSEGVVALTGGQSSINAAFDAYKANPNPQTLQMLTGTLQAVETKTPTDTVLNPLSKGATDLSSGVNELAKQLGGAAAVSKQISDGVDGTLVPGLTQLNSGLAQLNQKTPVLSSSIGQLYDGSSTLKSNIGTINDKMPTILADVTKISDSSNQLIGQLGDTSKKLNSKLVGNSDTTAAAISKSVEIKEDPINEVKNYGTGFAPYFISLSLYVGAMLMFFVITDKVDDDIKGSNASLVIGKFFSYGYIGVAQAVLASGVVLLLGLKPNNLPLYFLFIIFMSYVFIAIMQCLIFLLGEAGRMLAIAFLILQLTAAGGTFPNELVPSFFKTINAFMPFTYSIQGLREIISGTDYSVLTKDFLVLLGILIVSLVVSILFKGHADKVHERIEEKKNAMTV